MSIIRNINGDDIDVIDEGTERHDFGHTDRMGRTIGARLTLHTYPEAGGRVWDCTTQTYAHGTIFCIDYSSTRNGKDYGASQPLMVFKDETARFVWAQKYVNAAAKRAAKNAKVAA
jgi:hypothetical protein